MANKHELPKIITLDKESEIKHIKNNPKEVFVLGKNRLYSEAEVQIKLAHLSVYIIKNYDASRTEEEWAAFITEWWKLNKN